MKWLFGMSQPKSPEITTYYDQLNTTGKEAAMEQVRLLTLDEKYTRPDYLVLKAAHNDTPAAIASAGAYRGAFEPDTIEMHSKK